MRPIRSRIGRNAPRSGAITTDGKLRIIRILSKSKQTASRIAWGKLNAIADREMDSITINDLQTVVDEKAQTYYPAKDMKTLLSHLFKRAVAEGHAHRIPGHGGAGDS